MEDALLIANHHGRQTTETRQYILGSYNKFGQRARNGGEKSTASNRERQREEEEFGKKTNRVWIVINISHHFLHTTFLLRSEQWGSKKDATSQFVLYYLEHRHLDAISNNATSSAERIVPRMLHNFPVYHMLLLNVNALTIFRIFSLPASLRDSITVFKPLAWREIEHTKFSGPKFTSLTEILSWLILIISDLNVPCTLGTVRNPSADEFEFRLGWFSPCIKKCGGNKTFSPGGKPQSPPWDENCIDSMQSWTDLSTVHKKRANPKGICSLMANYISTVLPKRNSTTPKYFNTLHYCIRSFRRAQQQI